MKHVIVVTTSYPDSDHGSSAAGSFVMDFVQELSRFVTVTVVTPASESGVVTRGNITLHRFCVRRQPLSLLKVQNPLHWAAILTTLFSGKKSVLQAATNRKPDYIFALWALPSGYWANAVSRKFDTRVGIWSLGSDIWSLGKIPVIRQMLARTLHRATHRFADGLGLQRDVELIAGAECNFLPSSREFPVNTKKQYRDAPPYRLVFLGRWHPNKGTDILLDALSQLTAADWENVQDVRIFGGGPMEDAVAERIAKLKSCGLPVSQGGFINKQQAADLLFSADYAIIPSRIESIPVIFSDCIAAKCAIICTPAGDLPDLVRKYNVGCCAAECTASALAETLSAALRTPPVTLSTGMEDATRDFDIPRIVERFLSVTSLDGPRNR